MSLGNIPKFGMQMSQLSTALERALTLLDVAAPDAEFRAIAIPTLDTYGSNLCIELNHWQNAHLQHIHVVTCKTR